MKRKSKLLIVAALVCLIGGTGAYFGGKQFTKHRADRWRTNGIAAFNAGDSERAANLLIRYLRRGSGTSAGDVADYNGALEVYVKSLEHIEPPRFAETLDALKMLVGRTDSLEHRRHLLRVYVELERRPEALDTADGILSRKEWASDGETLELKSQALAALHRDHEALATATAWAQVAPLDVKAHLTILSLKYAAKQPDVIQYAGDLKDKHPGDVRFEFLLAYALDLYIKDPDARSNNDDTSRKRAAELLRAAAANPGLTEELALMISDEFNAIGMPDDSLDILQKVNKAGAGLNVRYAYARRCWELGRWSNVVDVLADLNPFTTTVDPTLVAMKAISLANLSKATESAAVRSVLSERKELAAQAWVLILRRVIDGTNVDDKEVVTKCRAALAVDRRNQYLEYYLGDAEYRLAEFDLAAQAWGRATADDMAWGMPATRLVEVLLHQGRAEEAHWVAYEAYRHSRSASSFISLSRAYAADINSESNPDDVDALLKMTDAILQKIPGEEGTLLIHIHILAKQKNDEAGAIKSARDAIFREPPPGQQFLLSLARLSRQLSLNLQEECFSRCEHVYGVTADLAFARAIDHLMTSPPDTAAGLRELDEMSGRQQHVEDQAWRLARARFLDLAGSPDAKAAWIALGDGFPDSVQIQLEVANSRAIHGDWDFGQRTVDRLHKLTGDSGLDWRVVQARLMVDSARNDSDYEQGALLLNKLIGQFPTLSEPHVLLAKALEHMKRFDGAIDQLTAAAKVDPFSVSISIQLAALLQSRGDLERAGQILDTVARRPLSNVQLRQVAILLAQQGKTAIATKYLERAQTQPSGSSDPAEGLLLAAMYRRRGDFDKCDALVTKLMAHPELSIIQFAASFYASQNRRPDAEAALQKLDALKVDPGIKELTWGSYSALLGNMADTLKYYEAATVKAPTNPVTWRMLSRAQVGQGKIDAAIDSVERGLAAIPTDPVLKTIDSRAQILRSTQGVDQLRPIVIQIFSDPLNSDSAVELLGLMIDARATNDMQLLASRIQQLNERHPDFVMGQIQLVHCLAAMGRREEALSAAQHAMTAFPDNPEPARVAAQLSTAWGRWNDVETAARAWRSRAPDDWNVDVTLARAQLSTHQYQAALSELIPRLQQAKANPDQYADLITTYCVCAANTGEAQIAADLLWPLAQKSADWRLRWVLVAANIDEVAEAVKWLDRVSTIIPSGEITQRVAVAEGLDLLGVRAHDASLKQKSAAAFVQICADPKVTAPALVAAGTRAERQNDIPTAMSFYRRALALDPTSWTAHNNLAVLIARNGGDLKEAVAMATAAVHSLPQVANGRDTLAEVEAKQGDFKAAAQAEQVAVQLEPTNAKWRVRMARYFLDANDVVAAGQAVRDFDERRMDFRDFSENEQKVLTNEMTVVRTRLHGGKPN